MESVVCPHTNNGNRRNVRTILSAVRRPHSGVRLAPISEDPEPEPAYLARWSKYPSVYSRTRQEPGKFLPRRM
jgi:hypothetical protein